MSSSRKDVAIIGSGCRFPGEVNAPSKLWDILQNPRPLAQEITDDRFSLQGFYHSDGKYSGHSNVKEAYLLSGHGVHRQFDATFFGISPAEASVMDPQARLLLETVYEALEAAGQTIEGLQGSNTAVYAGQMVADYEQVLVRDTDSMGTYHATGTSRALLSNRVSYFFDWHGPSMTIDTACSSSLVAVHEAVQVLRSGQSRVAVAAGANLIFDPHCFAAESTLGMLSPNGRSRMWDEKADGYARGEGVAAVILKTLEDAEADGDHIECVIRETGVNQDGRTHGITMPSAQSQAQLMRDCYRRAGLNPTDAAQRPQYFEAHGTGTPVGDPLEAEAISSVFFPESAQAKNDPTKLFVGSIKTLVGHTEGTAGLAGILKASLALQHQTIPPNLLFDKLNPKIEPFYSNLRIPVEPTKWPSIPSDGARRASVNSFGFGGTNAHAILESYNAKTETASTSIADQTIYAPLIFSAASESSLRDTLYNFHARLPDLKRHAHLRDIAFTLYHRRTLLHTATYLSAGTFEELDVALKKKLETIESNPTQSVGVRARRGDSATKEPSILAVFTGQGAQWPRMGAELIASSDAARDTISRLDKRLSQLPPSDVPRWTLLGMLESDAESSRIGEAEISQPICTAIQILQVDILRAAGVKFSAVVGHSSGEIGAAYAMGLLSAEDAICVAYYRGLHAHLAQGPEGQKGAMMAVGTSYEDAQDLCIAPEFEGRACVGSVNSPVSVTLSGNEDSIKRLEIIFEDEEKFTRILRVDKAYHSHHMIPCGEKYAESLSSLDIKIGSGEGGGRWTSSVYGKHVNSNLMGLENQYWIKNLLSPVLFKDAVEGAIAHHGSFDLIVEVGPHPALKGPVLETLEKSSIQPPPYTGLFHRGSSDITSVADAIGFIVAHLGKSSIDIHAYEQFISGHRQSNLVKGLPTYAWDHTKEHWHESRYARAVRMRPGPLHPLLGHVTADSSSQDMRWRHVLQPSKLPWLSGHELQGQMVFPAAGYVVMALEAGALLSQNAMVSLIELSDLDISKALTFDNEDTRVELMFSMSDIVRSKDKIEASIKCSAADDKAGSKLELLASGQLSILLGEPCHDILPGRSPPPTNLMKVRSIEFYSCLERLEYQYSGPFAALYDLERKLGAATGMISRTESSMLIHPAMLDAAFQSTLLVYSAPNDGRLASLHVPRRIRSVRANPYLCAERTVQDAPLSFDAVQTMTGHSAVIAGDIEIYGKDRENALIQIEGLECVAFAQSTALDDKELFSTVSWDVAEPNLTRATKIGYESSDLTNEALNVLERMASFYLRNLEREVPQDHPSRTEGPYQQWFRFAADSIVRASEGRLPLWQEEWNKDTATHLDTLMKPHEDLVDVKFVRAIGEYISDIATGLKSSVEISLRDDVLGTYYSKGIGLPSYLSFLARSVKQLTHRNPSMNILEVGAGTGACTKAVFKEIGDTFASYTFSDVTPGFADSARTWASSTHLEKMLFKTFDVGQPPNTQGIPDQTYDLIIASLVLHATPSLEQTLKNIRRILKPGGYLIALEVVPTELVHYGVMFGAFTGWWLGAHEGRSLSPALTRNQWNDLLETCGFSGCLNSTPEDIDIITPVFVFASQALDDSVRFLQNPLASADMLPALDRSIQELVIVGGDPEASKFVTEIESYVAPYCGQRRSLGSLSEISTISITSATTILCFADIAGSIWEEPSLENWDALKACLLNAGTLVWVTSGRRRENPYTSITIGLVRSAVREISTLAHLFIDIYDGCSNPSQRVSEAFLRYNAARSFHATRGLDTTIEAELVLDQDDIWLIPRLTACKDMNDRYNCQARPITTSSRGTSIAIGYSDSGMHLEQESLSTSYEESDGQIHAIYSLSLAVKIAEHDFLYLIMGQQRDSSQFKVALTTDHKSTINPWSGCFTNADPKFVEDTDFLVLVSYQIQASAILQGLNEGETLLVHEPTVEFAAILSQEAESAGLKAVFTTDSKATKPGAGKWLTVHPQATHRSLLALLPTSVSAFVDMANTPGHEVVKFVHSRHGNRCKYYTKETIFLTAVSAPKVSDAAKVLKLLEGAVSKAVAYADMRESRHKPLLDVLTIKSLSEESNNLTPAKVIDWRSSIDVQVRVKPADNHITFSPNRTYWLVGLTGSLGLSLCEWMIRHGAKHMVFTSRKPCIDERWLVEMAALGANVHVYQCDITKKEDVVSMYSMLSSTLPPIAGVAHGAMVLQDTPISNMSLDNLTSVLRPKVEGSLYLNEIFQEDVLDFFIFFSSATLINGNPGQSNYSAANSFMTSLAEKRRAQGLAASTIAIGPVFGIGYIAQAAQDEEQKSVFAQATMRAGGYLPTSEPDFHQLFAEAVLAGHPRSAGQMPSDLVTGLKKIHPNDPDQPFWASDPIMNHFVRSHGSQQQTSNTSQPKVSVETMLEQATDHDQVERIIKAAFYEKVRSVFLLGNSISDADLASMSFDQMGVDSLSAVEIRRWCMRTLEINIPVLKILNGATVGDLVLIAIETLPQRLVPNLETSSTSSDTLDTSDEQDSEDSQVLSSASSAASLAQEQELVTEETSDDLKSITVPHSDTTSLVKPVTSHSAIAQATNFEAPSPQSVGEVARTVQPLPPSTTGASRLSYSQEMIWFVWKFMSDRTCLNHTGWARITGSVDAAKLSEAVRKATQKHETLRACFFEEDGHPVQGIMETSMIKLELREAFSEEDITRVEDEMRRHIFDISRGDTMRLILLSKSRKEHFLVFGVHPLVMDGLSFQMFLKGLQTYNKPTSELQIKRQIYGFAEFAQKQRDDLYNGVYETEVNYWKNELAILPPPLPILNLSTAKSRSVINVYQNERAVLRLSTAVKSQIQAVCRRLRCTPFHFYLAVFRALLLRFAGDAEDIAIGIADANRTDDEIMDVLGSFLNILTIRVKTHAKERFDQLLSSTREKVYGALINSKVPFQALLSELKVARSATTTSLFQCFVDYRLGQFEKMAWGDAELQVEAFEFSRLPYDLALDIIDVPNGECIHILEVRKELYGKAGAERILESFELLINAFAAKPELTLNEPTMFKDEGLKQTLAYSRGPAPPSLWENTVIHRIREISEVQPLETAIRDYEDQLTSFTDLMAKANSIANELQVVGIQRQDRVAVLLEPTGSWIASIIGVMTLGAVYVPLDMSLPWQRLTDMVNDCSPKAIIVDQGTKLHQDHFQRPDLTIIDISRISTRDICIPVTADENDSAAILYTSGTSGTPKGIILSHKGLRNFVEPVPQLYNLGPSEVVLQQTSSSFDMSLSQIFKALCHGWSLSILPRELRGDALAISRIIRTHNVTVTVATPSEYSSWLGYGKEDLHASSHWKIAFCGGEPVTEALQSQFRSLPLKHIRVYNHYGPTETTFAATSTEVILSSQEEKRFNEDFETGTASAGFPLPGYAVYVLDDQMRPLPIGVQGEIYIGGAGVGHGYLSRPSLSSERFVADPFASPEERARGWTTLHRTGDVGRWNAKGALMIEGRKARDSQVKLRGIRVDLEEIENVILSEGGNSIHQAVVTMRQQDGIVGSAFLVAHVVLSDGVQIENEQHQLLVQISSRLRLALPQYMCPSAIMAIKQLPMTNAAKLDRTAAMSLPLDIEAISKQNFDSNKKALTATEERLLLVWEDVLPSLLASMDREGLITSNTDFFHAGGTSMLLLGLQSRIRSVFNVELSLIHMFESSTLGSMGRMIDQHVGEQHAGFVAAGKSEILDDLEVDWDEETKLSNILVNSITQPKTSPLNEVLSGKVVVLTGATGLLGRGLLNAMVKDSSVDQIHCMAVRNASSREELLQLDKVVVHEGDLADVRLGLSEQAAKDIFEKADIVIHNGADVSYLKSYTSLRACNVLSTKRLAELCAPRMIPFHYVSTMSVGHIVAESIAKAGSSLGQKLDEQLVPASVSGFTPTIGTQSISGASGSRYAARGYTASKWASERFLERLKEGVPEWEVVIHRPGLILPHEQDAQQGDDHDIGLGIVQNITHYATLLRAIPEIDNESRLSNVTTHLVPLDVVVKDMLAASVCTLGDQQEPTPHVRFVHQTDGEPLSLEILHQIVSQNISSASDGVEETEGGIRAEITKINLAGWALRAGEAGMHRTLVEMLISLSG